MRFSFLLLFLSTTALGDEFFGEDKALHFGATFIVSGAGYGLASISLKEPWQRGLAGFGAGMLIGSLKELADHLNDGVASWQDMAWNGIGSLAGAGLGMGIDLLVRRLAGNQLPVKTSTYVDHAGVKLLLAFSI